MIISKLYTCCKNHFCYWQFRIAKMKVNLLLQMTYFFPIYQLNIGVLTLLIFFSTNHMVFTFSCIIIQSFFPDTDVNISAMVIWLNRKKPTIEIAKNEAWQTAFFTDFICLTTRIIATVFRSFVTNVLFLFCCYVTLHSQHMHFWSGNNKKNQIQHFSFASIYFI